MQNSNHGKKSLKHKVKQLRFPGTDGISLGPFSVAQHKYGLEKQMVTDAASKTKTEEKIDELKGILDATEIKELKRLNYRLSDAIREGSSVTDKANGWGDGNSACTMHAAVIAAAARNFISLGK